MYSLVYVMTFVHVSLNMYLQRERDVLASEKIALEHEVKLVQQQILQKEQRVAELEV